MFSSSARPRPPKKFIAVETTAQSTFQLSILPKVPPTCPTPSIFCQAERLQLASTGCTTSPPKSVKAMSIMNTMGSTENTATPTMGSTRAVTWNFPSAAAARDCRKLWGLRPFSTSREV